MINYILLIVAPLVSNEIIINYILLIVPPLINNKIMIKYILSHCQTLQNTSGKMDLSGYMTLDLLEGIWIRQITHVSLVICTYLKILFWTRTTRSIDDKFSRLDHYSMFKKWLI